MTPQEEMVERVSIAKIERDRIIAKAEQDIRSAHERFASFLNIEVGRVAMDEEKGEFVRTNTGVNVAKAAGYARNYLYSYIKRYSTS